VLQAALQAAWAEILVETASSFHGLDSPSNAALRFFANLRYKIEWSYSRFGEKMCKIRRVQIRGLTYLIVSTFERAASVGSPPIDASYTVLL
jgi:hypothetical protein